MGGKRRGGGGRTGDGTRVVEKDGLEEGEKSSGGTDIHQ